MARVLCDLNEQTVCGCGPGRAEEKRNFCGNLLDRAERRTQMSESAVWPPEASSNLAAKRIALVRNALLVALLGLLLGLSGSLWLYFRGQSPLLSIATVGGASILGLLALAAAARRALRASLEKLKSKEVEWQKGISALQIQLGDSRSAEELLWRERSQASQNVARLESLNAQLREEMDRLKREEKTFWQRRQELESSKTVLELHVQERTGELQKLQQRYELILNSAGEGICGLDLERKAAFVNPAASKITGWPISELIGKTEEQIFGRLPAPGNGGRNCGEMVFHRKDGRCVPVEYEKTPIQENGRELGAVLVFKDISQRKGVEDAIAQKAAELARSNAELEQFAFVASHDLQEPLRKIQAFGDRLKVKINGEMTPEAQDYLDRMQNAAARMRTLINDLLTFSRVIRRSDPFISVDLGTVIKGVLGDLEMSLEKSGGRVEVGDLPLLEADPLQMHQLFLNLVGNALKFQPAGGKPVVKISSRIFASLAGEPLCEILVEDNGIGFEEKYLEKMFAVFQRLHGRSEYEGTGVGLAVCRRITDRHHGTVTARSQLGQGATFIVTLPLHQNTRQLAA
jgi:PAS domain S-box-containing protein